MYTSESFITKKSVLLLITSQLLLHLSYCVLLCVDVLLKSLLITFSRIFLLQQIVWNNK